MLVNRVNRILLPFLAGVLIIYPVVIFAFTFSHSVFSGANAPLNDALEFILSGKFLPFNVAHLWFLYFLMMYAIIGCLIAMAFKKNTGFTTSANNLFTSILKSFWFRLLSMTLLFFLCLYWMGTPAILTNVDWAIDPAIFVTYFIFFGTGWIIFTTNILNKIAGYSIMQLVIATLLFLGSIVVQIQWSEASWILPVQMLFTAVYSALYIFGFISFFLKYFNLFSQRLSYLMDASYWVYIIHLPIVAFMPGLITDLSLSPLVKFVVTLSTTSIICLASYEYLVRGRFIGKFLNGKVNKQKKEFHPEEPVLKL